MAMVTLINPNRRKGLAMTGMLRFLTNDWKLVLKEPDVTDVCKSFRILPRTFNEPKEQIHDVLWQLQQFLMPKLEKKKPRKNLKSPVLHPAFCQWVPQHQLPWPSSIRFACTWRSKNNVGMSILGSYFQAPTRNIWQTNCMTYAKVAKYLQIGVGSVCPSPSPSPKKLTLPGCRDVSGTWMTKLWMIDHQDDHSKDASRKMFSTHPTIYLFYNQGFARCFVGA